MPKQRIGLVPVRKTSGTSSKAAAVKTLFVFLKDFKEFLTEKNFATINNSDGKIQFSITTQDGVVLSVSVKEGGNYAG